MSTEQTSRAADDVAPDLERRFLCADGACIGTVERDGRCAICTTPIAPEDVEAFEAATGVVLGPEFERAASPTRRDGQSQGDLGSDFDDEDEQNDAGGEAVDLSSRLLCVDGACIGVIGSDNVCRLCGKPYSPEAA